MNATDRVTLNETEFRLFQQLLQEESGLFFDSDRQGLLRSGLAERMAARGVDSALAYFQLLQAAPQSAQEVKALIDAVTVGETYFFRNQPHFDALQTRLLPALIDRRRAQRRITVWSAACSTGEEPYSLAMLLLETLPDPTTWQISLLATDVNREHLRRGQEAEYGPRAVRQVPADYLKKYFIQRGGRYVLSDAVKRLVRFEYHNLVKDQVGRAGTSGVDFLFCRNVTIYFSLETTRRVMNRFATCLAPDGYLFIGDAETLWQICDRFTPVEFPHTFLYRLANGHSHEPFRPLLPLPVPTTITQARAAPVSPPPPQPVSRPASLSPYQLGLQALQRKDYTTALSHFDNVLTDEPANVPARLGRASILADREQHAEAIADLQHVLETDSLSCEAYYLLGALHARAGNLDRALTNLQRAVYVEPTLALGYFSLASIYRSQGRRDRARREFQNALRALTGKPDDQLVQFSEDITCGYLRAACHRCVQEAKL